MCHSDDAAGCGVAGRDDVVIVIKDYGEGTPLRLDAGPIFLRVYFKQPLKL